MAAHKQGLVSIPADRAIDFVAHLNLQFRGVREQPGADDPWVRQIVAGEVTPGDVAKHYRGLYQAAPTVRDGVGAPAPS
jgi:hypothetical protein